MQMASSRRYLYPPSAFNHFSMLRLASVWTVDLDFVLTSCHPFCVTFSSCIAFYDLWQMTLLTPWSVHLFTVVLTIVTACVWPPSKSEYTTTECHRHSFDFVFDFSKYFAAWQLNLGWLFEACGLSMWSSCVTVCCRNLRTLNVWRAKGLTDVGLRAIADSCHGLEELDAGWWSVELMVIVLLWMTSISYSLWHFLSLVHCLTLFCVILAANCSCKL